MTFNEMIPILRIFDVGKAKEFYCDFLEFKVDWVHQFEPNFPLYMQISKYGMNLHLSEHPGDCTPGAAIRIEVDNIEELHRKLVAKHYKYAKPGLEKRPWGRLECLVTDPFGNRIIFNELLDS